MGAVPATFRTAAAPAAALGALVVLSVLLRTTALGAGYWTDESIAVGIAAKPWHAIPQTLRLDGSPPLYYLLLHGWMTLVGDGEAATRGLSALLAAATIPVAWWAGRDAFGPQAGRLAAAAVAVLPFMTRYAQETRMYALVALLSLVVAATALRALRTGRLRDAVALALALTAVLYTHNWGLFLAAAVGLAWTLRRRRGRAPLGAGLLCLGVVAVLYAPWVPSLLFQVRHTAAPWARAPAAWQLLAVPAALAGVPAAAAIGAALALAARRRVVAPDAVLLLAVAASTAALAWLANQGEAAWAERYLAVLVGPLVLGVAGVLAAAWSRATFALVLAAVLACAVWTPPLVKSNARALAAALAPELRAGDVAFVAGPQHVPLVAGYLPAGLRFMTPTGPVADPAVTDWRDLVARMDRAATARLADRVVAGLPLGRRVVLIAPLRLRRGPAAPLPAVVRRRAIELASTLASDGRLLRVGTWTTSAAPRVRTTLRATVFERVRLDSR